MRLLFIGDVVGRAGRAILAEQLPKLRLAWDLDFVIVNGENAAGGFGITESICDEFLAAGADCVTLGNHAFDQREALVFIARQPRLHPPGQLSARNAGHAAPICSRRRSGARVLVINVLGRVFMDALDDPFAAIEREIEACPLGHGLRRGGRRSSRRGVEREAGVRPFRRWAGLARRRHAYPCADRRLSDPAARHGLYDRRRNDRRL